MTLAPAVRGLFGVEADAMRRVLTVMPHLPPAWNQAEMRGVRVGDDLYTITMSRQRGRMIVTAAAGRDTVLCINEPALTSCVGKATREHRSEVPLPVVELGMAAPLAPLPGSATEQPRVVDEVYEANRAKLTIEGRAGAAVELQVRRNQTGVRVRMDNAPQTGDVLRVTLPAGDGFVTRTVEVEWSK